MVSTAPISETSPNVQNSAGGTRTTRPVTPTAAEAVVGSYLKRFRRGGKLVVA